MNWWVVAQSVLSSLLLLLVSVALEVSRRRRQEHQDEIKELTAKNAQGRKDCEAMVDSLRRSLETSLRDHVKDINRDISELYDKAEVQVDDLQTKVETLKENNAECHRAMEKDVQLLHLEVKDLERDIPRNLHGIVMEQQREIERLRARVGTRNND